MDVVQAGVENVRTLLFSQPSFANRVFTPSAKAIEIPCEVCGIFTAYRRRSNVIYTGQDEIVHACPLCWDVYGAFRGRMNTLGFGHWYGVNRGFVALISYVSHLPVVSDTQASTLCILCGRRTAVHYRAVRCNPLVMLPQVCDSCGGAYSVFTDSAGCFTPGQWRDISRVFINTMVDLYY